MYVKSIELKNYRNYINAEINFCKDTNILFGDNAQGKTNLLEAVYLCSTTKSHRGSADKEIIGFGEEESHIKMIISKRDVPYRIDMHLKKSKPKGIAVNRIPIKRASELFGIVNVVFFSPEDLNLIKGGPAKRRQFIDMELCQLDKVYVNSLVNYNKCLYQRNQLLKNIAHYGDLSTLDVWDLQLCEYGCRVMERRKDFLSHLGELIGDIHGNLTNKKEFLKIKYEPCIEKEFFYNTLVKNREKDLRFKTTSVGPHRDDISFLNGTIDLRKYGSQGQQRTAALSLKLSEIELMKASIHDTPILLLDDVLSELDQKRQQQLIDGLSGIQTMISCTGVDDFIRSRFQVNKMFHVVSGQINTIN